MPGRREMSPEEALSRALSKTLRHKAKAQGFTVSAEGWVPIDEILASSIFKKHDATLEKLEEAVESNAKKRYELDSDHTHIRACQGHTMEVLVDSMEPLTLETLPPVVVHGTNAKVWEQIQETGLNKMKRQHIHLASGLPGTVISGMRNSATVFVYVDAPKAMGDGIEFYRASNGAILSPGRDGVIGVEYLRAEFKPTRKKKKKKQKPKEAELVQEEIDVD